MPGSVRPPNSAWDPMGPLKGSQGAPKCHGTLVENQHLAFSISVVCLATPFSCMLIVNSDFVTHFTSFSCARNSKGEADIKVLSSFENDCISSVSGLLTHDSVNAIKWLTTKTKACR